MILLASLFIIHNFPWFIRSWSECSWFFLFFGLWFFDFSLPKTSSSCSKSYLRIFLYWDWFSVFQNGIIKGLPLLLKIKWDWRKLPSYYFSWGSWFVKLKRFSLLHSFYFLERISVCLSSMRDILSKFFVNSTGILSSFSALNVFCVFLIILYKHE